MRNFCDVRPAVDSANETLRNVDLQGLARVLEVSSRDRIAGLDQPGLVDHGAPGRIEQRAEAVT